MIQENCHLNKMKVKVNTKEEDNYEAIGDGEENSNTIEVTKMDANVIMHLRSFDFIHLDPFGTSVNYLDSAFRNVRNLGIVSLTSTDISSLYAKAQHVALLYDKVSGRYTFCTLQIQQKFSSADSGDDDGVYGHSRL